MRFWVQLKLICFGLARKLSTSAGCQPKLRGTLSGSPNHKTNRSPGGKGEGHESRQRSKTLSASIQPSRTPKNAGMQRLRALCFSLGVPTSIFPRPHREAGEAASPAGKAPGFGARCHPPPSAPHPRYVSRHDFLIDQKSLGFYGSRRLPTTHPNQTTVCSLFWPSASNQNHHR